MKNKKFSGIFALLLGVCLALATFSFVGAKADGDTPDKERTVIAAMKYDITELYEGATAVVSVKKDGEDAVNGVDPEKDTEKVADYWYGTTTKEDDKDVLKMEGSSIVFNYVGENPEYTVTLKVNEDKTGEEQEKTVKVSVVANAEGTPAYNLDSAALKKVAEAIKKAEVNDDKKLVLPTEIWDLLSDETNYPLSQVTAKIYVKNPVSGWSSSYSTSGKKTSTLKVSLSDAGTYYLYVLFSVKAYDPLGNKTYTEVNMEKNSDWKEFHYQSASDSGSDKVDGFYTVKDENGDEVPEELQIPVFEYEYAPAQDVTISETISVRTGKVGMSYSSLSFTVENAIKSECVIMYAPLNSTEWVEASNSKAEGATAAEIKNAVAEYDEDSLKKYSSGSSITFTPLAKGQFKVVCKAMGANSTEPKTLESTIINVKSEMVVRPTENTAVRDFFKNNTLSVVFLGIALLCLVAIVVIAFWKPKDGTAANVEDKPAKKDEKVEEKAEEKAVIEADDEEVASEEPVKEAEDAPAEETAEEVAEPAGEAEEEPEAEPAEEAKESAPEAPAEEVKEAAPETPAEEVKEVAPETPAEEVKEAAPETTEEPKAE